MNRSRSIRSLLMFCRVVCGVLLLFWLSSCASTNKTSEQESWWLHPDFAQMRPAVIAVLPMENLTLEVGVEEFLFEELYNRLLAKGYRKISADRTRLVMKQLGIQVPGQLAGISNQQLQKRLNCDAVLLGRIDQSGVIHSGVYDAVVVSLSLILRDLRSGQIIWRTEQWRTAHRQWQLDPVNMLLNFAAHESSSRKRRIQWLVQEMLKTLPAGPVSSDQAGFLKQAQEIKTYEE